ncbi:molybdopterin-dependent oxidoreductase (plasmid) [Skermanella rosea]|uniref:xanthine dehydrogenase family protein molybdopterin-binding subunit n=1 Tax=Skermanella rosea TaxID=1817965 RepID=UPI001932A088|nr:molybdopterin cofactor-binding domain-containing protein [Skermanella rosea]UEM07545.1 molybdopterin-dependent oxidoreductase [Skermanella rosea]
MPRHLSRRTFLITGAVIAGTAATAAVAGVGYLSTIDVDGSAGYIDGDRAVLNAFVVIHPDGRVVVNVPRTEMGQGIHTGLAMLVAEELDLPFDGRITVEHPIEDLAAYANWALPLGTRPEEASGPAVWIGRRILGALRANATGGSSSMYGLWTPMRAAGAASRHMLVTVAAARLGVPAAELATRDGAVVHAGSGLAIPYADLALDAAAVSPPRIPALKSEADWRLIGTSQPRLDLPAKVRGAPVFGADVVLPDMLHASIRQAPVFGSSVVRVANMAEVRTQPGVVDVVVIDGESVAVIARSWWQAEQAAGRLDVEWTGTDADDVSSAGLSERMQALLDGGDAYENLAEGPGFPDGSPIILEAAYEAPLVAHACMEPMNATVLVRSDGTAEAWVPAQSPIALRWGVSRGAGRAGVDLSSVTCHILTNGGGFGRRTELDVSLQAAYLAALFPDRPVKLMWSREEDIGRGVFRSHAAGRLRAALGPDGLPVAYEAVVAAQSLLQSFRSRLMPIGDGGSPDGDFTTVQGLDKPYYGIAARRVASHHVPSHLPIGHWRSNGYSFNTFFAESFIDECAHLAGADPVDYRRALLRDSPRHLAVLERVAALARWGEPLPRGRGRGIAIEEAFRSIVAQVVEVTVATDGEITVDRVFCAIDVGIAVNPDAVIAQMEGSIFYGLTTALMSAITIENGAVVESNFHDFPMHRLHNAPDVAVEIMDSGELPGGAGEPGVVPVAPALANAIFDATGRRLRSLPLAATETVDEGRTRTVLPGSRA